MNRTYREAPSRQSETNKKPTIDENLLDAPEPGPAFAGRDPSELPEGNMEPLEADLTKEMDRVFDKSYLGDDERKLRPVLNEAKNAIAELLAGEKPDATQLTIGLGFVGYGVGGSLGSMGWERSWRENNPGQPVPWTDEEAMEERYKSSTAIFDATLEKLQIPFSQSREALLAHLGKHDFTISERVGDYALDVSSNAIRAFLMQREASREDVARMIDQVGSAMSIEALRLVQLEEADTGQRKMAKERENTLALAAALQELHNTYRSMPEGEGSEKLSENTIEGVMVEEEPEAKKKPLTTAEVTKNLREAYRAGRAEREGTREAPAEIPGEQADATAATANRNWGSRLFSSIKSLAPTLERLIGRTRTEDGTIIDTGLILAGRDIAQSVGSFASDTSEAIAGRSLTNRVKSWFGIKPSEGAEHTSPHGLVGEAIRRGPEVPGAIKEAVRATADAGKEVGASLIEKLGSFVRIFDRYNPDEIRERNDKQLEAFFAGTLSEEEYMIQRDRIPALVAGSLGHLIMRSPETYLNFGKWIASGTIDFARDFGAMLKGVGEKMVEIGGVEVIPLFAAGIEKASSGLKAIDLRVRGSRDTLITAEAREKETARQISERARIRTVEAQMQRVQAGLAGKKGDVARLEKSLAALNQTKNIRSEVLQAAKAVLEGNLQNLRNDVETDISALEAYMAGIEGAEEGPEIDVAASETAPVPVTTTSRVTKKVATTRVPKRDLDPADSRQYRPGLRKDVSDALPEEVVDLKTADSIQYKKGMKERIPDLSSPISVPKRKAASAPVHDEGPELPPINLRPKTRSTARSVAEINPSADRENLDLAA